MKKLILFFCFILIISCDKSTSTPSTSCSDVCSSVQCSSLTQQNVRCKNTTTNCCGRCYLHK